MLSLKGYLFGVALLLLANGILSHPQESRVDTEEIDTLSDDGTAMTKALQLVKNTVTEAVATLNGGGKLMTKTLKSITDIENKMKQGIEDGDRMIRNLAKAIRAIGYDKVNVTKVAIQKYIAVKTGLRSTRIELHDLGYRTVAACEDMKVFLESWDNGYSVDDQKQYLKSQFSIMKDLVNETDKQLNKARAYFKTAVGDIGIVETNLINFKFVMTNKVEVLENDVRESGNSAWTGVGTGCTVGIIGAIVADIFGCFGACTASVASICGASLAGTEILTSEVASELRELTNTVNLAIEDVEEILRQNDNLLEYIEEEEKAVVRWAAAAETLGDKIKKAEVPDFKWLPLLKKVFEKSLTRLEIAAKGYINRPDWSEENEQQFRNSLY